jgi:ABC-type transport system involved in Fe-S cluster assembly fused permease/ATPase subunit
MIFIIEMLIIYTIISIYSCFFVMFIIWRTTYRRHQDDQGYHEDFDEVD